LLVDFNLNAFSRKRNKVSPQSALQCSSVGRVDVNSVITMVLPVVGSGSILRALLIKRPAVLLTFLRAYSGFYGINISRHGPTVSLTRGTDEILIGVQHLAYVGDLIHHFDFYFRAVEPRTTTGPDEKQFVDFSKCSDHVLRGFGQFPVEFPSFPEPVSTADQYVHLSGMRSGDYVFDLGAYAGITTIRFAKTVGIQGRVLAVEADVMNFKSLTANLSRLEKTTKVNVQTFCGAVWSHDGELEFSSESNLGSHVREKLRRGSTVIRVPGRSLSSLVMEFGFPKVDVIKADIEGAEFEAFSDNSFFRRFRPTLIFEPSMRVDSTTRPDALKTLLESYGYTIETVPQEGSSSPLFICRA